MIWAHDASLTQSLFIKCLYQARYVCDHAYMLYGYRSCIHVIWVSIMYTCYLGIDHVYMLYGYRSCIHVIWVSIMFFITLGKEEQQKEAIPEIKLLLFLFLCTSVYLLYKLLSLALILNIFKT